MELESVIKSIVEKKVNAMTFDQVMDAIFCGGKWFRVSGETYEQRYDAASIALDNIISQMNKEDMYKVLKNTYYGIDGACINVADMGGKCTVIGITGDRFIIEPYSYDYANSWEDVLKKGRKVLASRLEDEYKKKAIDKVGDLLDLL